MDYVILPKLLITIESGQSLPFIASVRGRVYPDCDQVAAVGGGSWQPLHTDVFSTFFSLLTNREPLLRVDESIHGLMRDLVLLSCGFPRVKNAYLIALRRLRAVVVLCVCVCGKISIPGLWAFCATTVNQKPLTGHTRPHRKKVRRGTIIVSTLALICAGIYS